MNWSGMANKIDDGGSAFPRASGAGYTTGQLDGMSLRDYFAGRAMEAMLRTDNFTVADFADEKNSNHVGARFAYQVADAMIKARNMSLAEINTVK